MIFDDHQYPQVIPTPAYSEPGKNPPWHGRDLDVRRGITLLRVEASLRRAGRHYDLATPPDTPPELTRLREVAAIRRSAVLVALFEEDGEVRLILTRRSLELRNHRGEVALPGGRCDPNEDAVNAATREAHEEVDLERDAVHVVGWLTPIVTFASGSSIQPVIGFLRGRPTLRANPEEVSRVFDVALADLLEPENFLEQRWRRDLPRPGADENGTFPIYFYRVPGEVIWGATGRVLTELLSIVTGTDEALELGPIA